MRPPFFSCESDGSVDPCAGFVYLVSVRCGSRTDQAGTEHAVLIRMEIIPLAAYPLPAGEHVALLIEPEPVGSMLSIVSIRIVDICPGVLKLLGRSIMPDAVGIQ